MNISDKLVAVAENEKKVYSAGLDDMVTGKIMYLHNDRISRVRPYAFRDCSMLESVNLPKATIIGESAFYNCKNLSVVKAPNLEILESTDDYPAGVFENSKLETAYFPELRQGCYSAFAGCKSLVSAYLPKVAAIDDYMFSDCSMLRSYEFTGVTSVGAYAFRNCSSLINITLHSIEYLGAGAFKGCKGLIEAKVSVSTPTFENSIFSECSNLSVVSLPKWETLPSYTFNKCTALRTVKFDEVRTVRAWCFGYSGVYRVDLPKVTKIEGSAFYSCTNLSALILRNEDVCTLGNYSAFSKSAIANGTGYVYVPKALLDKYKTATNWSVYASQLRTIEDDLKEVGGVI